MVGSYARVRSEVMGKTAGSAGCRASGCPSFVGPSPQVLEVIREEMTARGFDAEDRRVPAGASRIGAEQVVVPGLNEGIFYPETVLSRGDAARSPSRAVRRRTTTGTVRCLVLLVDFSDNEGDRAPEEFRQMLFSRDTYPTGSMRDFYAENSYGQLDVDGEVAGWLRLPEPYSFYADGQSGTGAYPRNAQRMVEDALRLAAEEVDFGRYDTDGDGYLDGLFVVHAGEGAEAETNTALRDRKIWSHQWNLTRPFASRAVSAYSYFTAPEDGRVGVFCHEFGHVLGLPDLYDTSYRSEGVGVWCLMGSGSWLDGGLTPGHFCAWAKAQLGWIEPTSVGKETDLRLPPTEQNRDATYRLWRGGEAGSEYFLIENRQRTGFDEHLPSGGLLILHVNDSEHDNSHPGAYRVALEQADGNRDLEVGRNRGDDGDPYPGRTDNTTFDEASNPSSADALGRPTGVFVRKIAVDDGSAECEVGV